MRKRIQLYVNTTKEEAIALAEQVKLELINQEYNVVERNADIIIGFGGDGTLLHLLRESNYNISAEYIGVNCGTLGFLQDFNITNVKEFVKRIPIYVPQHLRFITLEVEKDGKKYRHTALNEFVIKDSQDRTFRSKISVMDEFLENYVGSGMIFSTPTGSTALNLSAGGAIIHPKLECIQITPREAIANSKMHCLSKSICIPGRYDVLLKPNSNSEVTIYADLESVYVGLYDNIRIYYRKDGLKVLKDGADCFIKTIREKLI